MNDTINNHYQLCQWSALKRSNGLKSDALHHSPTTTFERTFTIFHPTTSTAKTSNTPSFYSAHKQFIAQYHDILFYCIVNMPIKFTKETSSRLFRYVKTVDIKFNRKSAKIDECILLYGVCRLSSSMLACCLFPKIAIVLIDTCFSKYLLCCFSSK